MDEDDNEVDVTAEMVAAGGRVIMSYFEDHSSEAFARDVAWEVFREMAKVRAAVPRTVETDPSSNDDDLQL